MKKENTQQNNCLKKRIMVMMRNWLIIFCLCCASFVRGQDIRDSVVASRDGVTCISIEDTLVAQPFPQTRFYAVKTNLLFAATLCANLGFEAELWPKWSLDIPVWYSPYDITSTRKLRLLATQPEIRWWPKKAGEGHFFGLHMHIVGFNVAVNDHGRYQDPNHALWGMGLSYGYAMKLGKTKRWGLEFNIGAGFAEYDYDVYRNQENGQKFRSGSATYFGITRAGVSLSYNWYKERKNRRWMKW